MLEKIRSKDILKKIKDQLLLIYEGNEAEQIAFLLLQYWLGLRKHDLIINQLIDIELLTKKIENATQRLLQHEPIQYVLGEAHFYGLDFKVSPAVLIPRPETEELLALIIKENKSKTHLTALDIGTGSGCIPIVLAKNLANAHVHAIDVSAEALAIAKENAEKHQAKIHFWKEDILKVGEQNPLPFGETKFDVIVSNPPYISIEEKAQMQKNVLDYEPHLALFVNSKNTLLFYEKITYLAKLYLNKGGKLYFEINENFGNEVVTILQAAGLTEVALLKDLQGKNRIVKGIF